ncbi:hypothetical protein C8R45DRAFT_96788 [Mycena sanguinolenta]|nr:hypothetical protein C8R45DRAFT_96788 [Mycena sanguinolenta]
MSHIPKLLVTGLGILPYPSTRHSLGQLIVDELASRTGIRMTSNRDSFSARLPCLNEIQAQYTHSQQLIGSSEQLMNISGPSVAAACRQRGLQPDMLVVISDSADHDPCKVS